MEGEMANERPEVPSIADGSNIADGANAADRANATDAAAEEAVLARSLPRIASAQPTSTLTSASSLAPPNPKKKKPRYKESIIDHTYRDYSQVTLSPDWGGESGEGEQGNHSSNSTAANFPAKLHEIVSNPRYQNIICWMPHGRSWKIVDKYLLKSVIIPRHFAHAKFESFNRSVDGWGFKRLVGDGPDHKTYYHECFLRGRSDLTKLMQRLCNPGKLLPDKFNEPNFYEISKKFPLAPLASPPSAAKTSDESNGPDGVGTDPGRAPGCVPAVFSSTPHPQDDGYTNSHASGFDGYGYHLPPPHQPHPPMVPPPANDGKHGPNGPNEPNGRNEPNGPNWPNGPNGPSSISHQQPKYAYWPSQGVPPGGSPHLHTPGPYGYYSYPQYPSAMMTMVPHPQMGAGAGPQGVVPQGPHGYYMMAPYHPMHSPIIGSMHSMHSQYFPQTPQALTSGEMATLPMGIHAEEGDDESGAAKLDTPALATMKQGELELAEQVENAAVEVEELEEAPRGLGPAAPGDDGEEHKDGESRGMGLVASVLNAAEIAGGPEYRAGGPGESGLDALEKIDAKANHQAFEL